MIHKNVNIVEKKQGDGLKAGFFRNDRWTVERFLFFLKHSRFVHRNNIILQKLSGILIIKQRVLPTRCVFSLLKHTR